MSAPLRPDPATPTRPGRSSSTRGARFVAGLMLAGYGSLILLELLAHESKVMGTGLLVAGLLLLATLGRGTTPAGAAPIHADACPDATSVSPRRRALVAAGGVLAAGGILAYNAFARSTLTLPEGAILAYGIALLLAAPHLGRRVAGADVGTLVAWSLPLVAAPLGLYAVDAYVDARLGVGNSPLDWFIVHALVTPMAFTLNALGFDAAATDQVVALGTPRGKLFLTVGVVCAGLQPGVLFLGVFGLYAWQERTPPRRLAVLLALGLFGVYVANLIRLVVLALVGYHHGGAALQTAHAHAGWVLFVGWMMLYWWIVLRRLQGPRAPAAPAPLGP